MASDIGLFEPSAPCAPDANFFTYDHYGEAGLEGTLRIDVAPEHPVLGRAVEMMRKPHATLLGLSLGNGYFSRRRVEIAVCGFARLSGDVTVLVPDTIALHTYRALGYAEQECRARVKKHGSLLKNRAQRAIERARCDSASDVTLRLLDWERDVAKLPELDDAMARVEDLIETHVRFRTDVLATARSVLEGKRHGVISDAAVREAARYLLSELAFISIWREQHPGQPVVVPYHKPFTLGAEFCAGAYGEPVPGVTWAVYQIELADNDAHGEVGHGN